MGLEDNGPVVVESGGLHRHDLGAGGYRIDCAHDFWSSPTARMMISKWTLDPASLMIPDLRTKGGLLFHGCENFLCPGYDRRIEMHSSGA